MCGIAGFVGALTKGELLRMSDRIAHRGPDGAAEWMSVDGRVGLAHRRLSIIDLSAAANQPMLSEDGRVVLIYNGELYNFRELRSELVAAGFDFRTQSDTEVVLKMYLWLGVEMLSRLNGIFAFALWDEKERRLFAARDGVGVKPFYYAKLDRGFIFSSEIKSFIDIDGPDWALDPVALRAYMTFNWSPGERTLARGVKKLLPGHAVIVRDGSVERMWRFYDLPYAKPIAPMSAEAAITMVHDGVRAAVRRQMVSDVQVGACLSGGLDSSAVVAFAREEAKGGVVPCFTIKLLHGAKEEGIDDDLPYARKVARELEVPLEEIEVGPDSLALLPELVYAMDEPQADSSPINTFLIAAASRKAGIKVLLSGMGGDDIYTGYRRHYALGQESMWSWLPLGARSSLSNASRGIPVNVPRLRQIKKAMSYMHMPENDRIASYFLWAQPGLVDGLLAPGVRDSLRHEPDVSEPLTSAIASLPPTTDPINRMLYLDGKFFVPDHNLNYFDKAGMAWGVECRVPLLDIDLIDDAVTLPTAFKQRGREGKWVFKKAMETVLPHDVIYRPKTGFGMPLRTWMKSSLVELADELLSESTIRGRGYFDWLAVAELRARNSAGKVDATYTLLSMMNVELWCRIYVDRTLRPTLGPSSAGAGL